MKKIILTIALLVCATCLLQAQDTIRYPDSNYMYQPYNTADFYSYGQRYSSNGCNPVTSSYPCYVASRPTVIYGIANTTLQTPDDWARSMGTSLNFTAYAVLITKEGQHYNRIDSVRWLHPNRPDRYFVYPDMDYITHAAKPDVVVPSYEFYFDTPTVVLDTFYIGVRFIPIKDSVRPYGVWNTGYLESYYSVLPPMLGERYYLTGDIEYFYGSPGTRLWGGYFPILTPPDTTRCDPVYDLSVAAATDTSITLMWDGGNASQWEVEYAEAEGTVRYSMTTSSPMATLTGLRPSTSYLAHVRGVCTYAYSPWSHYIEARTGTHRPDTTQQPDTTQLGPVSISPLSHLTNVKPNPASGEVTVQSAYSLNQVVVYDLQGHTMLVQPQEGLEATLDVGVLPQGVYVMAIHTSAGIATKRLVVGP